MGTRACYVKCEACGEMFQTVRDGTLCVDCDMRAQYLSRERRPRKPRYLSGGDRQRMADNQYHGGGYTE